VTSFEHGDLVAIGVCGVVVVVLVAVLVKIVFFTERDPEETIESLPDGSTRPEGVRELEDGLVRADDYVAMKRMEEEERRTQDAEGAGDKQPLLAEG
jgi:hypothetical protein